MVIGNGLIANALKEYVDVDYVLIFASGVSDSSETKKESFDREKDLLTKCSVEHKDKLIVYFSSANLFENREYFRHKQNMEFLIKSLFNKYLIFRLPQVVGVGGNKNNLFNYFKNSLINGDKIILNRNAYRSLLDIDDLVKLIDLAVNKLLYKNETLTISYIECVGAGIILDIISKELNIKPNIEEIDGIEGYVIENSPVAQLLLKTYNKNRIGYIKNVIKKYL